MLSTWKHQHLQKLFFELIDKYGSIIKYMKPETFFLPFLGFFENVFFSGAMWNVINFI